MQQEQDQMEKLSKFKSEIEREAKTPADIRNEWYSKHLSQDLDWKAFLGDVREELWI